MEPFQSGRERGKMKQKPKGYNEITGSLQAKEPDVQAEDDTMVIKIYHDRPNEYPDGTPWGAEEDGKED